MADSVMHSLTPGSQQFIGQQQIAPLPSKGEGNVGIEYRHPISDNLCSSVAVVLERVEV